MCLNPYEFVRLWHDRQGRLVAHAMLGEDPSFDCQVAPEYQGAGLEAEALDWAETRLDALRRRDASQWSGPLVAGVRQDHAERIAFLEGHGFRYRGEFAEVNVPRQISSDCGVCIRILRGHVEAACEVMAAARIEFQGVVDI